MVNGSMGETKTFSGTKIFWAMLTLSFGALSALFLLYFTAPDGASPLIIWMSLAVFYGIAAKVVVKPTRIIADVPTFASIDVFFLIFYYLLFYWPYQEYVLGLDDLKYSAFIAGNTFVDESNRAVLLATIGLVGFYFGLWKFSRKPRWTRVELASLQVSAKADRVLPRVAAIGQIVLMSAYLALGLRSSGEGRYTNSISGGSVADGFSLFIVISCILSISCAVAIRARRLRLPPIVLVSLAATTLWEIRILLLGDRNTFLLIAMAAMAGVFTFIARVGRLVIVLSAAAALMVYNAVEAVRAVGPSISNLWQDIIFGGTSMYSSQVDSSSFNITTIGLRAGIAAVPSVYHYGFGWYKLVGFLGIVPLIRGYLIGEDSTFNDSAYVLSRVILGPSANWSVGSNVISDVQMDFGVLAVPFAMLLVGLFAGYIRLRTVETAYSAASISMYLITVALISELPRYALDSPVRFVVWTAAILWLIGAASRHPRIPQNEDVV